MTTAGLQLAEPLLAGVPTQGMQAQTIVALQDREGGTFFQEWSGLFCMPGEQGDALFFYYPRLQTMGGPAESMAPLNAPLTQVLLTGRSLRCRWLIPSMERRCAAIARICHALMRRCNAVSA